MEIKALILAAGQGKRLKPYTNNMPKCLVHLAGKPLLLRQIKTLRDNNIYNIHIATGYCSKEIEKLGDKTVGIDFDGDSKPDFKID